MPISTTFDSNRFVPGVSGFSPAFGHSSRSSRQTKTCPTISSAVRLRTSFWVPVWQKVQASVQPTWLEMQSVPRSSSGM